MHKLLILNEHVSLFGEVNYVYYSVKSHYTRTLVCSNFIALLSLYMYTGPPQVQQILETFLEITFTSLIFKLLNIMLRRMFDIQFFDIMNVSSTTASSRELKPFNAPFSSTDDPQFSWLKNQFLKYFEDWLKSIEERPGTYKKSEKQKMFISSQTYECLKITVHSAIVLVKFLIVH